MNDDKPNVLQSRFARAYYSATLKDFLDSSDIEIIASLAAASTFSIETTQRDAWLEQITCMRSALSSHKEPGLIAFEYVVPRIGRRIDVLVVLRHIIFVIEFKVGAKLFSTDAIAQAWDYALDLKNFHSTSHDKLIIPIVVATGATSTSMDQALTVDHDGVFRPVKSPSADLGSVMENALSAAHAPPIDAAAWAGGRYAPTPTIIDAAIALYGGHGVEEISRSDAAAINLAQTSEAITQVIANARAHRTKSLCFVTGVPGAGKTLVGLNVATQHFDNNSDLYSVFLSGNGPLVAILCEALARDKAARTKQQGRTVPLGQLRSEVKAFVQNVHHFRDECIRDSERPPIEHVALFDEAQRAWNLEQTTSFMAQTKKIADFNMSEPEFLISCMDRHEDWAVVVCLVGGGQEIHRGEAGIGEWIRAIRRSFPHWQVHISPRLTDSEYEAGRAIALLDGHASLHVEQNLHLGVSMRSFRAENVSALIKAVLDIDTARARELLNEVRPRYPIVLTRSLDTAKSWLRERARGSERFGIVVSSQASRLKPHAIDVRVPINPVHWFLHPKEDVRSSFFLEDAATEFHVQGLELDWTCLVWDGDFRRTKNGWDHWSFRGDRWQRIQKEDRKVYLKNAYRVLLTRARQGMILVVPEGESNDPTRLPEHYDGTFNYLKNIGIPVL
ncbi:MAG: DUF2075 domain-containing protein [Phycisphaerales bacterium]